MRVLLVEDEQGLVLTLTDASFNALNDSLIYKLFRDGAKPV